MKPSAQTHIILGRIPLDLKVKDRGPTLASSIISGDAGAFVSKHFKEYLETQVPFSQSIEWLLEGKLVLGPGLMEFLHDGMVLPYNMETGNIADFVNDLDKVWVTVVKKEGSQTILCSPSAVSKSTKRSRMSRVSSHTKRALAKSLGFSTNTPGIGSS